MIWYILWRIILWAEVGATVGIGVGLYFISTRSGSDFTWWLYNVISLVLLIVIEKAVKKRSDKGYSGDACALRIKKNPD